MGFITTVKILNDGFDQIEKNPEAFVAGIRENMNDGGEFGVGNHCNNVEVMKAGHADEFRLFAVYQNSIIELSPYSSRTEGIAQRLPHLMKSLIVNARFFLDRLEHMMTKEEESEW